MILSGKEIAASIKEELTDRIQRLRDDDHEVGLSIVRIGANPDDLAYEKQLIKLGEALGILVELTELNEDVDQKSVLKAIEDINENPTVDGCLILRPLPKHLDEAEICNALHPKKDIDGVGAVSLAGTFMDIDEGFTPSTADACLKIIDHYYGDDFLRGKNVTVVGRSLVIGKPVAMILLRRDATVTICHSKTGNIEDLTKASDVVICATGMPEAFGSDYFTGGQIIIDVGMNVRSDGSLCGDVLFDQVLEQGNSITPVPGGVGSVTSILLVEHAVRAAERTMGADS